MVPRGIRNNNPGNLNFAHQEKAHLERGVPHPRFAAFPTMSDGYAALIKQLVLYFSRGVDTVQKIISLWAPPNENATTAYASYVAKSMAVKPDTVLACNPSNLTHIAQAICHYENGVVPMVYTDVFKIAQGAIHNGSTVAS